MDITELMFLQRASEVLLHRPLSLLIHWQIFDFCTLCGLALCCRGDQEVLRPQMNKRQHLPSWSLHSGWGRWQ